KLAGMTGTAETEETEFHEIYKLGVSVIPTNRPVIRDDRQDLVYKTRREKYNAILEETQRLHELQFPVLVGTVSVDVSETLSRRAAGRSRRFTVLPVARRRSHASLRLRSHCQADGPDGGGRGRDADALAHHSLDRAGTEARRAAELPVTQTSARVRRRDESAARGDLLAADVRARGRGRAQGRSREDDR